LCCSSRQRRGGSAVSELHQEEQRGDKRQFVYSVINDGKIPTKYGISRKRSEETEIVFVFTFELFYHFRFHFFGNRYRFLLDLNFDRISKTISDNRKLSFPFSPLTIAVSYTRKSTKTCVLT
jgi:hypothetical protein